MLTLAALPTVQFVIGLREGVEASLIVGIVAAFLVQEGRRDALKLMWIGVAAAITVCIGIAAVLQIVDEALPQKQQEQLETVIAAVAVVMVTGMILWMRKHARSMGGELRASAATALAAGSAWGLIAMAFLAVLREGIETAFFLLATFQSESTQISTLSASIGAVLGVLIAVLIGWGIFRGGVKLNLARFFRVTAVFLVIIAAGLVAGAFHTGHEAGWVNFGQGQAFDLTWLVKPDADNVLSGLLTGLFGLQPYPRHIELIGWLVYAVPMLAFVLWPAGSPRASTPPRTESEVTA
ncbi:iron uptake transporter permease EfeU [Patulibacter sp.]|uniref:iron uptake transporter permease EfeU n=1 Tax=Patulibacter sp. TaxID=1912859 RepID=UPI00271826EF|nr:iron uptake transporter permease EfeU [Patulibacter sp.]MDO9410414.1 iron uptake transporter permease EfeU [Patulibacter sp.]